LLNLGLLHYLVQGWTFDNIKESTAIDSDTHHSFFHIFIVIGSTDLYKKWVQTPVNLSKARSTMKEYGDASFS
jgi:hypothetical protein